MKELTMVDLSVSVYINHRMRDMYYNNTGGGSSQLAHQDNNVNIYYSSLIKTKRHGAPEKRELALLSESQVPCKY